MKQQGDRMDRLTKWNGVKYILPQGRTEDGESNWRRIADRLAAYEDTGLEPDEIMLLIKWFKDSCVVS